MELDSYLLEIISFIQLVFNQFYNYKTFLSFKYFKKEKNSVNAFCKLDVSNLKNISNLEFVAIDSYSLQRRNFDIIINLNFIRFIIFFNSILNKLILNIEFYNNKNNFQIVYLDNFVNQKRIIKQNYPILKIFVPYKTLISFNNILDYFIEYYQLLFEISLLLYNSKNNRFLSRSIYLEDFIEFKDVLNSLKKNNLALDSVIVKNNLLRVLSLINNIDIDSIIANVRNIIKFKLFKEPIYLTNILNSRIIIFSFCNIEVVDRKISNNNNKNQINRLIEDVGIKFIFMVLYKLDLMNEFETQLCSELLTLL